MVQIDIRVQTSEGRWARRRVGAAADSETGSAADTAAEETVNWEFVESPRATLWRRALYYLLRLAKVKRHWAAGGTALRFLAERRKKFNDQIETEIKVKAEIAAKAKKDGLKSAADRADAGASSGSCPARR